MLKVSSSFVFRGRWYFCCFLWTKTPEQLRTFAWKVGPVNKTLLEALWEWIAKYVRFFVTKCDSFIAKCDSYYKMRRCNVCLFLYHKLWECFLIRFHISIYNRSIYDFDPFVPNSLFLYSLKTSENRKVFWCFQGVKKGCIGSKWVNIDSVPMFHFTSIFSSIGKYCYNRKQERIEINMNIGMKWVKYRTIFIS